VRVRAYVVDDGEARTRIAMAPGKGIMLCDNPAQYIESAVSSMGPLYGNQSERPLSEITVIAVPKPINISVGSIVEVVGTFDATENTIEATSMKEIGKYDFHEAMFEHPGSYQLPQVPR
ncbi:MAG: hypothetical protein ACHQ50_15155, partial [Fimbriimonadales bacterium]